METPPLPPGIRRLPIVAGHLALDFANTVDDPLGPLRHDHVASYASLLAWAVRTGVLTDAEAENLSRVAEREPRRAAATVGDGARLRAALNGTFGALADGTSPAGAWLDLRPFVAGALGHADLPGPQPQWDRTALESPLWPVAESAYRLVAGPDLHRLKRCAGCPWLFLDQSKNGSRRWCSMRYCGTDEKIRKYVSRRASARSQR